MLLLQTKDGSRIGNAILYGGGTRVYVNADIPAVVLYFVETDFGNHMRLTWKEILDQFEIGPAQDYRRWKENRRHIQNDMMHIDPNQYLPGTLVGYDPRFDDH